MIAFYLKCLLTSRKNTSIAIITIIYLQNINCKKKTKMALRRALVIYEFPKYQMADELSLSRRMNYDIVRVTRAMLEIESPLSEEWLLKRIVFLFDGREKVTNVVRDEFDRLMWNCQRQGIIRRNGFLYLQGKEIPMLRVPMDGKTPRDIKYIAVEELANGLKELLKRNVTAEKAGLFKLLVEQLGFARMGDAILARLESALKLISKDIETNGDMLSLRDN